MRGILDSWIGTGMWDMVWWMVDVRVLGVKDILEPWVFSGIQQVWE